MRKLLTVAAVAMVVGAVASLSVWAADVKEIKDVMKEAHGGGKNSLREKVTAGNAAKEDKEKLLALYEDLAKNKPPQGDAKSWKTKTETIVKAAKEVVDGKKSEAKLKNATNCKNCHDIHKPAE